MPRRPEPSITIETAHDVRQLRQCGHCGGMGDRRHMPKVGDKLVHGFCAVEILGVSGILKLPHEETVKFTLGEIGVDAMRRLVDNQ